MLKLFIMEMFFEQKEKKVCFFKYMKELHAKAQDYFIRLPKGEWILFQSIPGDIFTLVFNWIDRSPNITVDKSMNEFLIMDKRKFPE